MATIVQQDHGLAAHLADNPPLVAMLGLQRVPHFTTFQKASRRLLRVGTTARSYSVLSQSATDAFTTWVIVRGASIGGTTLLKEKRCGIHHF